MNNLSWAIYGLDVLENVVVMLEFSIFLTIMSAIGYTFIYFMLRDERRDGMSPKPFFGLLILLVLIPIRVVLPSTDTVKIIIASEVGEAGIDKFIELSKDEQSIVFKGMKKLESILEVEEETKKEVK